MIRTPRPGPGNGWRHTISSGRPSSCPSARTSSLNSSRSGSTSSRRMSSGRPPTLWWLLMTAAVPSVPPHSMRSGYSVPCTRNSASIEPAGVLLEDADELVADRLALGLRIGDAGEPVEEAVAGVDVDQLDAHVPAERLDDLRRSRPCASARCRRRRTSAGGRWPGARGPRRPTSRRRPTARRSPGRRRPGRGCARPARR